MSCSFGLDISQSWTKYMWKWRLRDASRPLENPNRDGG